MLKIDERRRNHAGVQRSLAMYKAPDKVRDLVQSISQEQLVALSELGRSLAHYGKGDLHEIVGFLSGHIKEINPVAMDWICKIK